MIITSLVTLLVVTIRTIVSGARTHHIHHGVENAADTWDDVWVVHLTRTTLPHVCNTLVVNETSTFYTTKKCMTYYDIQEHVYRCLQQNMGMNMLERSGAFQDTSSSEK